MRRDVIILFCAVLFVFVNACVVLYLADYRSKCCSQLIIVSSDFVNSRGEQHFTGNWLPGCQDVCYFRADSLKTERQAVTQILGEGELNLTNAPAQSPNLGGTLDDVTVIYNVLPGTPNHPWRQIKQTAPLNAQTKDDSVFHIIVVNKDNVVLVYNTGVNQKNKNDTESEYFSDKDTWIPKEVSLVYRDKLVLTEIAWTPRSNGAVYHVTWEVQGGGLEGHLFTDATHVTLSLWPETTYHIQVEMVSRLPEIGNDKSEPLTVDTSQAKRLTKETKEDIEFDTVKDMLTDFESSMHKEHLSEQAKHFGLIMGGLAALSAFTLGAIAIALWQRRQRYSGPKIFKSSFPILLSDKVGKDICPIRTLENGVHLPVV